MAKPSAESVRKENMITLASAHAVYIETARRLAGQKGLEAVGEANRLHGLELGEEAVRAGYMRKGDLHSLFEMFDGSRPYFGFELSVIKSTDDVLEMKVTYCPWIETFKKKGAGKDICTWLCKMDEGIGQAVDPTVRMTLLKCMMRGDEFCIYRWEKHADDRKT
ncbi:MAG: L-2-amino-thiazoline-4-carboxylic acid hydrolase [Candidatus Thorarchaeota archaeon]